MSIIADLLRDPFPGLNPNRPARAEETWLDERDQYDLLFVEFDDQGRLFDPKAIDNVRGHLNKLLVQGDVVILVFAHGWKHGARDDDQNVESIHDLLHTLGHVEALDPERGRQVVGIYLGWRGLTLHWAGILENVTFWSRKEAAMRVALGSARELFASLLRLRREAARKGREATRLIIAGHSFGALVVYAALAERLIESVVADDDMHAVRSFGDMTILVNPAFEASRYYPLHSIVARRRFAPRQAPVFVSVTAENDWATGWAFPIGRHLTLWNGATIGEREQKTNVNTMGHIPWMQTHKLTKRPSARGPDFKRTDRRKLSDPERTAVLEQEREDFRSFRAKWTDADGRLQPGWRRSYTDGAELRCLNPEPEPGDPPMSPDNPFWVVRASSDVVNGHNGVFGEVFLSFLRQVVDDVIRTRDL